MKTRAMLPRQHGEYGVLSMAFSPDDRLLATGNSDGTVSIWDLETKKEVVPVSSPAGRVTAVAVSHDGRSIASGGMDRIVRVWDSTTGKQRFQLTGHSGAILDVEFSPNGRLIASSGGGQVRLWDAGNGDSVQTIPGYGHCLAFSPDSTQIAGGGHDVRIWDVENGFETARFTTNKTFGHVWSLAYTPGGKWLAYGMRFDDLVGLWNPKTDQLKWGAKKHPGGILSLGFSPDGKTLVVGTVGVFLRDLDTGKTIKQLSLGGITAMTLDGQLAHSTGDSVLSLSDPRTDLV